MNDEVGTDAGAGGARGPRARGGAAAFIGSLVQPPTPRGGSAATSRVTYNLQLRACLYLVRSRYGSIRWHPWPRHRAS